MKILGDMHTHTIASSHAFSTLKEMTEAAKEAGHSFIAITDHGPEMNDGANRLHFVGLSNLPEYINGVRVYKGAEVNIKDANGRIDLKGKALKRLEFVIASFHKEAIEPMSEAEHTQAWLKVIANPFVDCLGHMGNPVFSFDHETVMKALKDSGKIFEINANSPLVRKGSEENCRDLIRLAKKYEIPVIANSDAHIYLNVGNVENALTLLKEEDFPEDLILNLSKEKMDEYIKRRRAEKDSLC